MTRGEPSANASDPFDLQRFVRAQEGVYETALVELQHGQKRSHWMWFVFPQIEGLGHSETARYFAVTSLEEARQYLRHPVLGRRLAECAQTLLAVSGRSASQIFGYPDDLKLKSSMTLFAQAAGPGSVYEQVLDRYFGSEADDRTLQILEQMG
jgi:uncharacterized protein (DUF1810 family)